MAGMTGPPGRKPFTYCPGGIDFSQLKSPKMAKRIAKHQAQMNKEEEEPSSVSNKNNIPDLASQPIQVKI